MRLASFALASTVLASLGIVSACAPYAGGYGYTYQTAPAVGSYGYADPAYAQPYYAQPYGSPYYAEPPVAGAVIIGTEGGYDRRREGWRDDRRPDRPGEFRRQGDFQRGGDFRRGGDVGGERFGNRQPDQRPPEQRQPDQRQRPVFANQPAQPQRAAPSPIPPPPSGGRAFEEWSRRNVNSAPSPTDMGSSR